MSDMTYDQMMATIQSLIDASVPGVEPDTVTTTEWMASGKCRPAKAREQLKQLVQSGHLRPDWVTREDAWGTRLRVKGYRVVSSPT